MSQGNKRKSNNLDKEEKKPSSSTLHAKVTLFSGKKAKKKEITFPKTPQKLKSINTRVLGKSVTQYHT